MIKYRKRMQEFEENRRKQEVEYQQKMRDLEDRRSRERVKRMLEQKFEEAEDTHRRQKADERRRNREEHYHQRREKQNGWTESMELNSQETEKPSGRNATKLQKRKETEEQIWNGRKESKRYRKSNGSRGVTGHICGGCATDTERRIFGRIAQISWQSFAE